MLACHPNIVVPPEAGFALWLYPQFRLWDATKCSISDFITAVFETRKFENWELTPGQLEASLLAAKPRNYAALVDAIYRCYACSIGKNQARWGDKNNHYLNHIAEIRQLFPSSSFIHITRDPRNVVCSYLEVNALSSSSPYAPRLPQSVESIAREWNENIGIIRGAFDAFKWESVVEIRFEDLLTETKELLESVCRFLHEPFDPVMLDYHSANQRDGMVPQGILAWKRLTLEPPRRDRNTRYQRELDGASLSTIEAITKCTRDCYGY